MARRDRLITGAHRAVRGSGGSHLTQHAHIRESERFIKTLRQLGFGVQKWANVSNKHVMAVVNQWKLEGLSNATLKEYLSGVRLVSRFYDGKIAEKNISFGINNRIYISNINKAVPDRIYDKTITDLKNSADYSEKIVASQLQLQRCLGLRKEESFKFNPKTSLLADGRVIIQNGTKGGRERILFDVSEKAIQAIEFYKQFIHSKSSIPIHMTERQWERQYYRILEKAGLTKRQSGFTGHGLRHAYAQEQYKTLTGFDPPLKFGTREEFISNAKVVGGEEWADKDRSARQILMAQLGHGGSRNDVISQYIGSCA